MKVVYLTWGETPRSYGVYNSQVLGQFIETHKIMEADEFHFIAGVPLLHSGIVREKMSYLNEVRAVKEKLGSIKFYWLPIFSPQNFVNSNRNTFPFIHAGSHYPLKLKLNKIKPDIVHCRSYHAAWAALQIRANFGLTFKVIFDGRGLWPEEIALKKNYDNDDYHYLFLKSIEAENLKGADITIAVSDTMAEHYVKLGAKNVRTIYLSCPTKKLKCNIKNHKEKKDQIVFCYVGALSDNTWHKPKELLNLYKHLRSILPRSKLLIITTSNHDAVRKFFLEIPEQEVVITKTQTSQELKSILDKADIGLMSYFNPKSEREIILGATVLAVKTGEYLASGLPVIINSYCGGAAEIVRNYSVGITYDPNNLDSLSCENIYSLLEANVKKTAQSIAYDLFDYRKNAIRYKNIYSNLVG